MEGERRKMYRGARCIEKEDITVVMRGKNK